MAKMKNIFIGVALALLLSISGCVGQFTASTTVHYKVTAPSGVITEADWTSNKNEEGINVKIDPKTGEVNLRVNKAGTPEASIAAALENSKEALGLARDAMAIGKAVATKGAVP